MDITELGTYGNPKEPEGTYGNQKEPESVQKEPEIIRKTYIFY